MPSPEFSVSSTLSSSQISKLFNYVLSYPCPISTAARYIKTTNKDLLDFLETEHGKAFFITDRPEYQGQKDPFRWVRANTLNLIKSKANLRPIAVERARCIRRVMTTNSFGYWDKKKKEFHFTNRIYYRNRFDFLSYLDRTSHKALLFTKDLSKPGNFYAPNMLLPYATRFNDKKRMQKARDDYQNLWDWAALKHQKAAMVTLTSDPKLFDSLWDCNSHVSDAFHDFVDFMRKRIKAELARYPYFKEMAAAVKQGATVDLDFLSGNRNKRIKLLHQQYSRLHPETSYKEFKAWIESGYFGHDELASIILQGYEISSHYKDIPEDYKFQYLNVLEFQKNGRLHNHIAVFGMDYVLDVREMKKKWQDYGQGEVVHAYSLKKHPDNPMSWTWKNPNNRPSDCRNKDPVDYLREYLSKAQYGTSVNYWTFNSRYFTNSRNFEPEEEYARKAIIRKFKRMGPKNYIYIKSIRVVTDRFKNVNYIKNQEYLDLANKLLVPTAPAVYMSAAEC